MLLQLAQQCDPELSREGFHFFVACWFKDGGDEQRETVKIFFWLVALFFVLVWVVLYLAVVGHGVNEARERAKARAKAAAKGLMSQISLFIGSLTDSLLEIWIDQTTQPGIFRALALLLRSILLLAVGLPSTVLGLFFWSCLSLWARVTRVGYSRVPGSTSLSETAAQHGVSLMLIIYMVPIMPLGVSVLILLEIYSVLLSPHQQLQGDFVSRYENLKRVLEPVLESLMQAIVQGAFVVWNANQRGGKLDWNVLLSVIASVMQVYQVYYYIDELAQKYKTGKFSIITELVMLGSVDKAPFRLVLLKWPAVDYSVLSFNNLDAAGPTEYFKQIGDALPGNAVLTKLRFAVRQVSADKIDVLIPALAASQKLQELRIVEDGRQVPRRTLPGRSAQGLLASCSHLKVAQVEGIKGGDYSCFLGLAGALRGMRSLKELCLAFAELLEGDEHLLHDDEAVLPQQKGAIKVDVQKTAAEREMADLAGYFATVKSLSKLKLNRVPPGILPTLIPGLAQNKSIKHLDMSGNDFDAQVLRQLAAWVRKGHLEVLILHDIRIVKTCKDKDMSLSNALAVLDVLKAVSHDGCRLQVFDLMLAHEHEAGLGDSGMQQLSRLSKAAAKQARTLKFLSVGVLALRSDDTHDLHQHSTLLSGASRSLMSSARHLQHDAPLLATVS